MPELPEVETVRRSLEPLLVGRKIIDTQIYYGGIIKKPTPEEFREEIKGRKFEKLNRRGKYLLAVLSGAKTLVVHLRMTGRLTVTEESKPLDKHTHLVFTLDNGCELRFNDVRKFGLIYLVDNNRYQEAGGLASLGPEPLEPDFTVEELSRRLESKNTKLKSFLLDQRQIAGLGNIYADEALFAAGLHPERRTGSLTQKEIEGLYQALRSVLQAGIELRGTTFRDYVDGTGAKGGFQDRLKVYGRAGQKCDCGCILLKKTVAGRTTVFCPTCQI
ncbi:MAG: DNA-formamidopyrimidine glycosylase [Peptococcia bacterium]